MMMRGGGLVEIDGECLSSLSLFMKPLRVMEKGARNPHRLSTYPATFNFVLVASANAHMRLCQELCFAYLALLMLPEALMFVCGWLR